MTLIRAIHDKENPYVLLNTTIATDNRLSAKAKGIWLYAFSKSADWNFYLNEIVSNFKDGEDSIKSGLSELEKYGYLYREAKQNSQTGMFEGHEWYFFETPKTKEKIKKILPKGGFSGRRVFRPPENPGLPSNNYNQIKTSTRESEDQPPLKQETPNMQESERGLGLVDQDLGAREMEDLLMSIGMSVDDCDKLWRTLTSQFLTHSIPERMQAIRLTLESMKRCTKVRSPIAYMISGSQKRLKEMALRGDIKASDGKTTTHQCDGIEKNRNALKSLLKWDTHKTEKGWSLCIGADYIEFTNLSNIKRFSIDQPNFINLVQSFMKNCTGRITQNPT